MAGLMGGVKGGTGSGGTSLQTSSSASGKQSGMFDDSGFTVNFGNGNSGASSGAPGWFYPAIAIGAVLWLMRRR